jgi:hypothetical protein
MNNLADFLAYVRDVFGVVIVLSATFLLIILLYL